MTTTTQRKMKHAIHAYLRIWLPQSEEIDKLWDCDRQIDAGEWSDSHWSNVAQTVEHRIIAYVADRFEFSFNELEREIHSYLFEQEDYWRESLGGVPDIYV